MNKLPKPLKETIVAAQRQYATSSNLEDVISDLKKAIPLDPGVFLGFRHFVTEAQKSEFDSICEELGLCITL
ncbi:hypothetical protein FO519_003468 [Halicephalobus sp. NKZ332]|nr:hypothetical protein FO519_003468 [Halicephalobus sp. NKZ332]